LGIAGIGNSFRIGRMRQCTASGGASQQRQEREE
jgi:hypothetical protein